MIYPARVTQLSDDIDEEVTLTFEGLSLVCFGSVCPYPLSVGQVHPVRLSLVVLNDLDVSAASPGAKPFERLGTGFAYRVRGRLNGARFEAGGLVFDGAELQSACNPPEGSLLDVRVDRIDAEFLPQVSNATSAPPQQAQP